MADRSYRVLFWCLALVGLAADQVSKYGVFAWLFSVPGRAHVLFQSATQGGFELVAGYDHDGGDLLTRGTTNARYSELSAQDRRVVQVPAGAPLQRAGKPHAGQDDAEYRVVLVRKGEYEGVAPGRYLVDGEDRLRYLTEWPHVNHGALFGFLGRHETLANAMFACISLLAALAIIGWSFLASTARDTWLCAALGLILGGTLGNLYDRVMFNGVRDFLHWFYLFDWPVFNIADCCLVCGAGLLLIQAFFGQQVLHSNPAPVPPAPGIVPTEVSSVR